MCASSRHCGTCHPEIVAYLWFGSCRRRGIHFNTQLQGLGLLTIDIIMVMIMIVFLIVVVLTVESMVMLLVRMVMALMTVHMVSVVPVMVLVLIFALMGMMLRICGRRGLGRLLEHRRRLLRGRSWGTVAASQAHCQAGHPRQQNVDESHELPEAQVVDFDGTTGTGAPRALLFCVHSAVAATSQHGGTRKSTAMAHQNQWKANVDQKDTRSKRWKFSARFSTRDCTVGKESS